MIADPKKMHAVTLEAMIALCDKENPNRSSRMWREAKRICMIELTRRAESYVTALTEAGMISQQRDEE